MIRYLTFFLIISTLLFAKRFPPGDLTDWESRNDKDIFYDIGNVGIGTTTSIDAKLEVSGNISATSLTFSDGTSFSSSTISLDDAYNGGITILADSGAVSITGDLEVSQSVSAGSLTVSGGASITNSLQVTGGLTVSGLVTFSTDFASLTINNTSALEEASASFIFASGGLVRWRMFTDTGDGEALVFRDVDENFDYFRFSPESYIFNEDSQDLDFRAESNNDINAFFINGGTDNVGIGTNIPNTKLEVSGDISGVNLIISNGASITNSLEVTGTIATDSLTFSDFITASSGSIISHDGLDKTIRIFGTSAGTSATSFTEFWSDNSKSISYKFDGTDIFRIDYDNNRIVASGDLFLIGDDIKNNSGGPIRISPDNDLTIFLDFDNNSNDEFQIFNSDLTQVFTVLENGNTGIGSGATAPGTRLEVSGGVSITNSLDVTGTGTFTGNVGIGTIVPGATLEVRGANQQLVLGIVGDTTALEIGSGTGFAQFEIVNNDTNAFQWLDDGSVRMTMDANGNVGIGTSTPGTKLDVSGGVSITSSLEVTGTAFFTGNVGIGTIAPATLLEMKKVSGDSILKIQNTGNGNSSGILFSRERLSGENIVGAAIYLDSDTSTNNTELIIQVNSSTNFGAKGSGDQRIVLDAELNVITFENANVGIGNTTPNFKLDVVGDVRFKSSSTSTNVLTIERSGGGQDIFLVFEDGDGDAIVSVSNSSGTAVVQFNANPGGKSYFNGGNVGMGTTSPVNLLHIEDIAASAKFLLKKSDANITGDEVLGEIIFGGIETSGGTEDDEAAYIHGIADGGWDSATDTPTRLEFGVTAINSGTAATVMTIDSTGNVGIGTTSPNAKLEVSGTISGTDANFTGSSSQIIMKSPDGTCATCTIDNSDVFTCTSVACP